MKDREEPRHAPLVCGALGRYERSRVERMAGLLGDGVRLRHEDEGSILMIDREPLAWSGTRERGLGWIEGAYWRDGANDWREASRLGSCGLALAGRRRFVYSAINGLAPIYWTDSGGATYFASRLEPLARSSPSRLSVDWDAWTAIIAMRYPLGERTPFAEIRRLGPFATLRRRFGRARAVSPSWPWAELKPDSDVDAGAEATAAALREAMAPLTGEVLCPLSGGYDSRLLISVLAASDDVELTAITVNDDEGALFEEPFATKVAKTVGADHEQIVGRVEDYWAEWELRARRVEHQLIDHPWLVPISRRVAGSPARVPDGFALDTLLLTGTRFHTPEVVDADSPKASNRALFDSLRRYGHAHRAFKEDFHAGIVERARSQFHDAVKPFVGHPSQPLLATYATRTVRGISTYPSGLLGQGARALTPGVTDAVATSILSVPPAEKVERRMISAVQRQLLPSLAELPSTNETVRPEPTMTRRWCSEAAVEGYRRAVGDGPLAEHVVPELTAWLENPQQGEIDPHLRVGMETIGVFHDWWRLYRDVLVEPDPRDLVGRAST